jgi:hypothetical protein
MAVGDSGPLYLCNFELVEGSINARIDDAYRAKYRGSQYLSPLLETFRSKS